jgi:hypothetical protein
VTSHRVPFSPLRSDRGRNETVTRQRSKQRHGSLSINYVNGRCFALPGLASLQRSPPLLDGLLGDAIEQRIDGSQRLF